MSLARAGLLAGEPVRLDAAERRPASYAALAAQLTPLAAGVALWLSSLRSIDVAALGDHGLLDVLPVAWYAALALLVLGGAAATAAGGCSGWVTAAYVGAVVAVLYATIPAAADAPQYPWTYKHIGVTALIDAHHGIDTSVDIYNRWPGLFAAAAAFSRLAGLPDPVSFAAWAEPLFMAIDALLVAAIAHALTRSPRVAGASALLFVLFNWVGQTYFSPQAAASTLALALLLVVLRAGLGARAAHWLGAGEPEPRRLLRWSPWSVGCVVLLLDVAVIVTHQLTPFAIAAQVGALAALGVVRSWRLLAVIVVLPVVFLLVNFGYVNEHFTLLTSLDPFDNLRSAGTYDVARSPGKVLNADLSLLLSAGMFAGTAIGAWVLRRRGLGLLPWLLLALAFSPFAVALLQSYGGEASLRVILYAAPWASMLVAAAIDGVRSAGLRVGLAVAVAGAACALTVPAFFGVSQLNVIPRSTVAVSEQFYAQAPAGSVLMLAGPGFPLRVGPRYDRFRGPIGDADPNLLHETRFRERPLGAADLPAVVREIQRYAQHGFLAFSDTQLHWAATFGLTPPGALADLERAVAGSPLFRLRWRSPTARIYELTRRRGA